ncbi:Nucleotide-binding universal stress protein, UspA family [Halovenus aranensis]|uniref:Nucleotide-binding universal stress protein, UspA family n=1 Tax=Halovenus aranensis TaxID=890420 RepID=A0A1G8Y1C9_9EURY|nr:universal stress protein [Halovenus aranensis]SDJ96649.1 Nucleotide-binding universal stress protein, UspA family [Halovenus aranensis]
MYRVLIPVDDSESRALAQANYVTSLPNADEEIEAILLFVFTDDSSGDVPRSVTRVRSVRRAREHLEDHGVEVTVHEDSMEAVDNILRHAEEEDVDSIVLGGRKRSPAGKALFGSVTQRVILNTDKPVVVTGENHDEE